MTEEIVPQDEQDVKEEYLFGDPLPYGCDCVLPEHHCPDCEAAARAVYGDGDDELPF